MGRRRGVRLGIPLVLILFAIVVALVPYQARAGDLPPRWLGGPPQCSGAAIEVFRRTVSQEYKALELIGTRPKPNPCRSRATRRLGLAAGIAFVGLIGVGAFVFTRRSSAQEASNAQRDDGTA